MLLGLVVWYNISNHPTIMVQALVRTKKKKKKHYALLRNKTKGKSRKCVKIWRKAIEEGVGEEEIGPLNISRFSLWFVGPLMVKQGENHRNPTFCQLMDHIATEPEFGGEILGFLSSGET
jgi:hypothetical protein